MGLQADLAGNKAMTITRRQVLKWVPPVVGVALLPVHAQTTAPTEVSLPSPECIWLRDDSGRVLGVRPPTDSCVEQACATETTPEPGPLCRGDAE
jgi:hypothetical protein